MSVSDEELKRLLKQLLNLLEDPQPGLFTWQQFRYDTSKKIHDALNERLKEAAC